ncbi:hypothetical protein EVAR_62760_1 [Eumeta japonica]|uniref:Uncharacterized protein n=1 Tax=Eumeta variegata TaxID=151549 RepID=A0A4C1ZN34_EUMVA|nr:hypothetical protein EVAR_62760_1 [Eumeta japonica]
MRGREPGRSVWYGRESVYRAHMALSSQILPQAAQPHRHHLCGNKPTSSALSSNDSAVSEVTIRGSDNDASMFQLVKLRKDLPASSDTPQARKATTTPPAIAGAGVVNNKMTSNRPTVSPKIKPSPPPPVYLRDKNKWSAVSSAFDRFEIQYISARNLAYSIKITVPTITDFKGLNNYSTNNIASHNHLLENERNVKAVICGIPFESTTDEVMTDLAYQGYAVQSRTDCTERTTPQLDKCWRSLTKPPTLRTFLKNCLSGSIQQLGYQTEHAPWKLHQYYVLTIMLALRVVKSAGFAELKSDFYRDRTE